MSIFHSKITFMKKLITSILFTAIFLGVQAQNVPEVQKSLVTKVTASWCPNCGSWGWDFFEDLRADNSDKAILLGCHHSGTYNNPTADVWTDYLNPFGQPQFFLGTQNVGASPSNMDTKRTEVQEQIDLAYMTPPVAGVGFTAISDGMGSFTVEGKVKFFQSTTGDFSVGIYLLEDGIMGTQSGQTGEVPHPLVLTKGANGNVPILINSGAVSMGTEVSFSTTLEEGDVDLSQQKVIAVIWEDEGGDLKFVNVNSTSDFTNSSKDLETLGYTLSINPNIVTDHAQISITAPQTVNNAALELVNLQGQVILATSFGTIREGENLEELEIPSGLAAGMYWLKLSTKEGMMVRKMFVQ